MPAHCEQIRHLVIVVRNHTETLVCLTELIQRALNDATQGLDHARLWKQYKHTHKIRESYEKQLLELLQEAIQPKKQQPQELRFPILEIIENNFQETETTQPATEEQERNEG